jgi:hypothetical protein
MGYRYEATKAERTAAALLRKKGWSVNEPRCPICFGRGFVMTGGVTIPWNTSESDACPNGCDIPMLFYSWDSLALHNRVIADGTVGMRRGV